MRIKGCGPARGIIDEGFDGDGEEVMGRERDYFQGKGNFLSGEVGKEKMIMRLTARQRKTENQEEHV